MTWKVRSRGADQGSWKGWCLKTHVLLSADRLSKCETHTEFSGSLSFHTECPIFLKDSSKETPQTGRGTKGTAERLLCFFFLSKCQSFGAFYIDFKARGGCSSLLLRTATHNTTQPQICMACSWAGCVFLSLRSLYSRHTKFLDSEGPGWGNHWSFFLLPSIYGILCFFPLVLAAYLLPCIGGGEMVQPTDALLGPLKTVMGDPCTVFNLSQA